MTGGSCRVGVALVRRLRVYRAMVGLAVVEAPNQAVHRTCNVEWLARENGFPPNPTNFDRNWAAVFNPNCPAAFKFISLYSVYAHFAGMAAHNRRLRRLSSSSFKEYVLRRDGIARRLLRMTLKTAPTSSRFRPGCLGSRWADVFGCWNRTPTHVEIFAPPRTNQSGRASFEFGP